MFGIKRFTENVLASQTEATFMTTECKQSTLEFHGLLHRKVKARFDGERSPPMLGFCYCERWKGGRV